MDQGGVGVGGDYNANFAAWFRFCQAIHKSPSQLPESLLIAFLCRKFRKPLVQFGLDEEPAQHTVSALRLPVELYIYI
jgi:hypothetical protein